MKAIRILLTVALLLYSTFSYAVEPWGQFALQNYVDRNFGESGQYVDGRDGLKIRQGHRAPGSNIVSDEAKLTADALAAIQNAFSKKNIPKGIDFPPHEYTAWQAQSGAYLVTFCISTPSEKTEMVDVWDEALGKLVQIPARRHFVQAAAWINKSQAVILREDIRFDADVEIYGCRWWPHDVVDIDRDGNPEVVLFERGYESESLEIFTIADRQSIHRWTGLGYGL